MKLTKPWHYILFFIIWVPVMLFILFGFFYMLIYDHEVREVIKFSQLSVCTKDGETVKKTSSADGSPLFHVSQEMERIYICGSVDTPRAILLSIDLYAIKNGNEHVVHRTTPPKTLQAGSFVFDMISKKKLDSGEYRARLTIGRINHGDVRFLIEQ